MTAAGVTSLKIEFIDYPIKTLRGGGYMKSINIFQTCIQLQAPDTA